MEFLAPSGWAMSVPCGKSCPMSGPMASKARRLKGQTRGRKVVPTFTVVLPPPSR
jgi:hypothetical protein